MAVRQMGTDVYEVDSDSSNRAYIVSWGTEGGNFWCCTCASFSIKRNKLGGLGNPGDCKHVKQVEEVQQIGEQQIAASLQKIEQSLRKS